MLRKDRMGKKRRRSVTIHQGNYTSIRSTVTDCNEAIWCKLVTGHTTVTIGVVYRCPNITKENNEKIHNAISEVSKGDYHNGGF